MVIEIDGIKFEGTGKNKKLAKAAAAKNALLKLYNVLNIEGRLACLFYHIEGR